MISSFPKLRPIIPRLFPTPKPKRLPKEKRMTIAMGVLSQSGIVIAADTEETGNFKRHQPKILPVNVENPDTSALAMAITGSGDAGYLDCISDELKDCFCQHRLKDFITIENSIKKHLQIFYKKHVFPFAAFPFDDRPSMSLIIGIQKDGESQLFVTDRNTMRPSLAYEAVGVGAELAQTLLQRLYPKFPTTDVVEALATYVAFQVKEMIPGCGKSTTIIRMENNRAVYGSAKRTRAMEEIFRSYLQVERAGMGYIFGSPEPDFIKHVANSFKGMQKELADSFAKFPNEGVDTVLHTKRRIPRIKE
jgi:20S proteasome alpha/beta subunit